MAVIELNEEYIESSFDGVSEEFIIHINENDINEEWDGRIPTEAVIINESGTEYKCWLREASYIPGMEEYVLYYAIYAEDLEK